MPHMGIRWKLPYKGASFLFGKYWRQYLMILMYNIKKIIYDAEQGQMSKRCEKKKFTHVRTIAYYKGYGYGRADKGEEVIR